MMGKKDGVLVTTTTALAGVLVCVVLGSLPAASSFVLEGSDTSYARFSRWNVNTTLSFEFTTNQPDGLILYTDDGGKTDFFELKLVEGILRLRFNVLNQGTQLVNIGHHLNDGLWHRVELAVSPWNVLVTVDGFVSQGRNNLVSDRVLRFDNTGVFIGGLPGYFNSRLGELTLPSVVFEPRFRGAVRNLVYGAEHGVGGGGPPSTSISDHQFGLKLVVKPQEIVESKGLISGSGTSEACERHDPCLHGGFCISTDSGPVCDCKHIDFEGVNCETEKSPTTATFHGTEYIGYDFRESGGHQPIISQLDEISLYFKTSRNANKQLLQHNNLLFYSGDGVDYIALTIGSGQLMLSINLGGGPLDTKLHPDHLRFDDGEWHSVRVHRKIQEITASVDGIHFDRWTLSGSFTLLSSNRVTVAGYDTLRPLNGIRGVTNFIGCLKKVEYRADTLRLNILELARSGNRLVTISGGRLVFHCQDQIDAFETGSSGSSIAGFVVVDEQHPHVVNPYHHGHGQQVPTQQDNPITFTSPHNSYLTLSPYQNTSHHTTSLSLKLRTTEQNGVVLYSSSPPTNLFALEILEGQLFVHMQVSSTHTRVQATSTRINDGEWHTVKLIRNGRTGTVSVDDLSTDFNLKSESRSLVLGVVYLGNVPGGIADERVWNVGLGTGFVGCLKNLVVEHTLVDLVRLANSQDIGGIRPYCQVGSAGECVSNPCLNNGKCADGWGRFLCECIWAGFDGGVCQVDAPYLDFADANVYEFTNRSSGGSPLATRLFSPTQAQDIRFRFKSLNPNAVLLSVSGTDSDFVEVRIGGGGPGNSNAGKLRVRVRLKDSEKTLSVGHSTSPFNDNSWHVFQLTRRGPDIRVFVDDLPPVQGSLPTRNPTLTPVKITLSSITSPFTGQLQSLNINNVELLSAVRLKRLKSSSAMTPTVRTFKSINNPIQFPKRKQAPPQYLTLPQLKAYSTLRIRFKFKTQASNGVLFYNGASSSTDYVCVQVLEFKVVFAMGFGETDKGVEIVSHRLKIDTWVDVDLFWDGGDVVAMAVDQYVYEERIRNGVPSMVLKLNGVLYVGGGVGDAFHSRVRGDFGFVGCVANVDLGGEGISFEPAGAGGITHGCGRGSSDGELEPYNPFSTRCASDTCENGGRCIEEPDSVTCDCEMTSYTGPTCSLESTTYEFGMSGLRSSGSRAHSRPGVIQFTYQQNREPTTLNDNIAFGFITSNYDAVMLRIESVKTTDYLEIELISGKLRVTYNMYLNKDHTIGDVTRAVNDQSYHVVKFTRNGANATLQIDNSDIITTYPLNLKENLFNSIGVITVGGRVKELKREVTIVRGFKGIISGLVINGMHILDMAMNGDPRVRLYGDVRKIRSIGTVTSQFPITTFSNNARKHHGQDSYAYNTGDFQRAAPASSSSTTSSDDLVSSGDGAHRCLVTDDEDNEDCAGGMSSGFTDDIITPVYIPTTRITTTITTTKSNPDSNMYFPCAEDDEDCVEYGSGVVVDGRGGTPGGSTTITTTGSSSSSSSSSSGGTSVGSSSTEYYTPGGGGTSTEYGAPIDPTHIHGTEHNVAHHHTTSTRKDTDSPTDLTTTSSTSTTTRFIPNHPASIPPFVRGGRVFDFDLTQATPSSTSTVATIEKKKNYNETVHFADSGDSTLIIIIIIAVLMIIIVSILIIFFMCKRRDDPIYKIEQASAVQGGGVAHPAAVQQVAGGVNPGGVGGARYDMGGPGVVPGTGAMLRGGGGPPGGPGAGGPRKTGVKEWYV